MSNLTIYRASAGSGKTFAITREYIRLLFADADNYRRTLGVTFTNKATAEMKSRIITELYKLTQGEPSGYTAELKKTFNLPDEALKQKAKLILSKILHDYSHFSILTIDSFFQRVIRAFAREIGFYQGFDIELDQDRILTAAIDQMIFELDKSPNLKEWLVRFAEAKIEDGGSWDINRDIEKLGREVFKENFNEIGDQLIDKITDKEFLSRFRENLEKIKVEFETEFRQKGVDAVGSIRNLGLTADDFKGKSRSIGSFFDKLSQAERFEKFSISNTVRNHWNDVDKWKTDGKGKSAIVEEAYHSGLNRLLGEILEMYDTRFPVYQTANEVQKHLYVLGVVADLLKNIREYTSGRNLFMISDTARFLQRLISNSDAPFIYERTGTFVHHFMIDEFQDTSSLQWQNFRPLIANSLAENNDNWIVGDVKQSIYRWRNSDWTILSDKIFTDIQPHPVKVENLHYNWRSCRNIIQFNNSFFRNAFEILLNEVAAKQEGEGVDSFSKLITSAYTDFAQLVPAAKDKDRGLVQIETIPATDDKESRFEDTVLEKLPSIIEQATDKGYSLKDMAILVRTSKDAGLVSEYLLKYQKQQAGSKYRYDIISNESLLLKNSEVVKWLIAAFTIISRPEDLLNKAFLVYEYETYINPSDATENIHHLFKTDKEQPLPGKLGDFFTNEQLRQYPVYELSDLLIGFFELADIKGELPFIMAFQDMLQEYVRREAADLNSFLQWWDENQDKRVISMPDTQDAIRLMTFHKSKGLEFKVVIIPFADWDIVKSGSNTSIMWCGSEAEPFNTLELLPLNMTKTLQNTLFGKDYAREVALSYIDNLNLLYVAFTRAEDALFVFLPETGKDEIGNNTANLISLATQNQNFQPVSVNYPAIRLPEYIDTNLHLFTYGAMPQADNAKTSKENIRPFEIDTYIVRPLGDVVKQVIPANGYFDGNDETLHSRINSGKVMHELFQQIKTKDDVDTAIRQLCLEGKITEADRKPISKKVNQWLANPKVSAWFSGEWTVRNEADILLENGSVVRPDRVLTNGNRAIVIDYKFGETEQPAYERQVRRYMGYLQDMKYQVDGYLWYVEQNIVKAVTNKPVQGVLF
jgi:ATP-dependent exoDNAse (exonuclease V) beta subunit